MENRYGQAYEVKGEPLIVNGREYSSFFTFYITLRLWALRGWQIVSAPDADGNMCDQLLLPLEANGVRKVKNGWQWCMIAALNKQAGKFADNHIHSIYTAPSKEYINWMTSMGMFDEGVKFSDVVPIIGYTTQYSINSPQGSHKSNNGGLTIKEN
jgi:hypothetical protein